MWTLKQLQNKEMPTVNLNGKWVPARPENYKKDLLSLKVRLKYAWEVFQGKAETFVWPEEQ